MQRAAGKQLFSDACGEVLDPSDARGRFGASPPMVMSDQQARLSGRKGDAGPRAVCCWRFRFLGSSERTEPIAPDQSARRNGNLHRTLTAPAIGATAIADCLIPANWPRIVNTVQFSTHCDQI